MIVAFEELNDVMKIALVKSGFTNDKAELCARIFAVNSRDGVHSHGLNRFPTFIKYIQSGFINVNAEPIVTGRNGCIENWDGQLAPGMYTATKAMNRAIEISKFNGMGSVAVKNTNHWMRGGTYGWQAAENGCIAICCTNAIANMPPWGGKDPTLGNNPLVIAIPGPDGPLVLDMAMSQFSYGKLQEYEMVNRDLPVPGGYDKHGNLTIDPAEIIASKRTLPIGYWKGSGLSMMIDVLVSCLSNGKSVARITSDGSEYGVSQFFLCLSPAAIDKEIIREIIDYAKTSSPVDENSSVRYPGENTLKQRKKSEAEGVEVNDSIWHEVRSLI
jgi:3-dehydro-L-gulonate 2-dehydrogenase